MRYYATWGCGLAAAVRLAELRDFSHAEMFALETDEKAVVSEAPKVSFGS
jgi:hypothetical protein